MTSIDHLTCFQRWVTRSIKGRHGSLFEGVGYVKGLIKLSAKSVDQEQDEE